MAKKEMRVIVASADTAELIDRGADIDAKIASLSDEDRGIKAKLYENFSVVLAEGETSVRVKGKTNESGATSYAVVTASEAVELNVNADGFPEVRKSIDVGVLDGIVERKLSLAVSPADVVRAAATLTAAGIPAMATESLTVKAEALRGSASSTEQANAIAALKGCVLVKRTLRVKYERK